MRLENSKVLLVAIIVAIIVGISSAYVGVHYTYSTQRDTSHIEQDSMSDIIKSKELRVGFIVFPPSVMKAPGENEPSGHMIAAVKAIASEIGVKVNFQETTWANFAGALQAKQFHVVVAPLFATPSRAVAVSFTEPLYYLGMAIIGKKGETRFDTLNSLDKDSIHIAVNQGGANQRFAKKYFPVAKRTELSTSDISQVLSEVIAGRADVAIADTWSITKFAKEHAESVSILFSGKPFDVTGISWAVRPEDVRLIEFMNTSINYLHTTGKMEEFERQSGAHWLHLKREWAE